MNVANYLPYNKQNASVRVKTYSNVIYTLFWHSFTLNQVTISMSTLSKVSWLFPCSSKRFLNFKLPSTRLLIKWFLINKRVSHVYQLMDQISHNEVPILSNSKVLHEEICTYFIHIIS